MSIIPQLSQNHIIHLQKSGLNENTLTSAGIFSADKEVANGLLRRSDLNCGGIAFPYPHIENHIRIRLDEPMYSSKLDDGYGNVRRQREIRYLSPRGGSNHLYLPVSKEMLEADCRLYITEGEKKALALIQAGLPAIGISGVWAWRTENDVCDEFNLIRWKQRPVTIIFDSDATNKRPVHQALKALANELADRGAEVSIFITPPLGGTSDGR